MVLVGRLAAGLGAPDTTLLRCVLCNTAPPNYTLDISLLISLTIAPMRDFRSEKMDSLEGEGVARGRFHGYVERMPDGFFELADEGLDLYDHLPDEYQSRQVASAIELAGLVSFWLSWHLAGGFAGLERSGWNRSTIFRKVRRFRDVFDEHPDSYHFGWLRADWDSAWTDLFGGLVALAERQRHVPADGPGAEPDDDEPPVVDED